MSNPLEHVSDNVKFGVDAVSVFTVAGTLAQILPAVAAAFTIIWTAIRIYETRTVQRFLGRSVENVAGGDDE